MSHEQISLKADETELAERRAEHEVLAVEFLRRETVHQKAALLGLLERMVMSGRIEKLSMRIEEDLPRLWQLLSDHFGKQYEPLQDVILADKAFFQRLYDIYNAYRTECRKTEDGLEKLRQNFFGDDKDRKPEQMWGKKIFEHMTGGAPKGMVAFSSKEAFVIISYDKKEDYQIFLSRVGTSAEITEESAGIYAQAMYFLAGTVSLRVVVINGGLGRTRGASSIVAHERQHFVNDRLVGGKHPEHMFTALEQKYYEQQGLRGPELQTKVNETALLNPLKNEVLAYIRDGTSGKEMCTIGGKDIDVGFYSLLKNGRAYRQVFELMGSSRLRQAAEEQLALIARSVDGLKGFSSQEAKAILVNELISVPFLVMAEEIEKLGKYYSRRLRDIGKIKRAVRKHTFKSFDKEQEAFLTMRPYDGHTIDARKVEDIKQQLLKIDPTIDFSDSQT